MLWYAWVLLAGAILCAILGFGIAAAAFTVIAKVLFFLFLIGFVASLVFGMSRSRV